MRTRSLPRTRRLTLAGAALLLGATLAACGATAEEDTAASGGDSCGGDNGGTRSFEADNGTVEIPEDPQRIIATGYAVPVMLEADACLVGISDWGRGTNLMTEEDLAQYEEIDRIMGETADTVNYEAVANAQPDVIILGIPLPVLGEVDMDRLEDVAPVVVLGPTRPDDWKTLSQKQSEAAGVLDYYDEAKAAYEERAAELTEKWADTLEGVKFGHVGDYGDVSAGNFHREYAGSWGTNIAGDIGVEYYGEPEEPGEGSAAVSEYPAIEELPESLGEADAITYSLEDNGKASASVQYVLDSDLWQGLPAVQDEMAVGMSYTEAATYPTAMRTLEEVDRALGEIFPDAS